MTLAMLEHASSCACGACQRTATEPIVPHRRITMGDINFEVRWIKYDAGHEAWFVEYYKRKAGMIVGIIHLMPVSDWNSVTSQVLVDLGG